MKRVISMTLAICMILSLGICSAYADTEPAEEKPVADDDPFDRVTLDAGSYHFIGLKEDGTVIAGMSEDDDYGSEDDRGQCDVGDWTDIVSVAAGFYLSLGLKADGTVLMAGDGSSDGYDVSGWADIVDIAAGYQHCVGLRRDGTVVTTGHNDNGQCNVEGWTDIVDVAAGSWHTIGIRSDGTVVATGENKYGQCNVSDWTNIVAIGGNNWCTVGIKADGTVVYAGGHDHDKEDLPVLNRWSNVVDICAFGSNAIFGITADHHVLDAHGWLHESVLDGAVGVAFADWTNRTAVLMEDGTVVGGNNIFDGIKLQVPVTYTLPESAEADAAGDSEDMGPWILKAYVDEFDLPTDDYFIVNDTPFSGTFSNSATTGSDLLSFIFYEPYETTDYISIRLFEYGRSRVNNPYSSTQDYDIILMDKDGNKSYLSGSMYSQDSDIDIDSYDSQVIINALKKGGTVRFAITESDDSLTKYIITIDDATGFDAAYRAYWNS